MTTTRSQPALVRRVPALHPITETVRGLLLGTAIGNSAMLAIAWCAAITLVGYLWAKKLYNRDPGPTVG